ncbi:MAG TPA: DUF58 domain-containing protein [Gemmatimonadales bacterium]
MQRSPLRDAAGSTAFLDPKVLATIGSLELLARTVVDGFLHGLHRSARLGLSMEFAEHRPYMPGDDIRRIDWRVFGRTDRYYVKEYEAETNVSVTLLLDLSASMAFGTGPLTKLDYGRYLTACLAWFSARQRDRIGLALFDREIVEYIPPSTRHLQQVLYAIDRLRPGRRGDLATPLRQVAERARRRGLMVVVSDFYEEPDRVRDAIALLRATGADVLAFHLLDPAELEFPFEAASVFEDLESGERLPVIPVDQRARYRDLLRTHLAELGRRMAASRVDYAMVDTSRPLDFALYEYLARREELRRTR